MEATCFSETSIVFQWITQNYIPEDRISRKHFCEYLNPTYYLLNEVPYANRTF
jgi:hypothetical protein